MHSPKRDWYFWRDGPPEVLPNNWRAAFTVNEDAFLEWSQREPDTFEIWQSQVVRRRGFEPWHLRVVTDSVGEVVAMALLHAGADPSRAYYGTDARVHQLLIGEDGEPVPEAEVRAGPRIGITRAAEWPLRFWVSGSPSVSRR